MCRETFVQTIFPLWRIHLENRLSTGTVLRSGSVAFGQVGERHPRYLKYLNSRIRQVFKHLKGPCPSPGLWKT